MGGRILCMTNGWWKRVCLGMISGGTINFYPILIRKE